MPADSIWKANVHCKVQFFAWVLYHDRINTAEVIQKEIPNVVLASSWCFMCKNSEETADHLFLRCKVTSSLWNTLFQAAKVSWAFQHSCVLMFIEHVAAFAKGEKARVLWKCSVLAALWVIWLK